FTDRFPTGVTLVVSSDTRAPGDPAFDAVVADAARRVAGERPLVGGVVTPAEDTSLAYPEARTALVSVGFTEGLDESLREVDRVIAAARAASTDEVAVGVTGGPAIFEDFNTVNEEDLKKSEALQVPFILLVLVLFFGSLVAAGIPIAATVIALASTLGGLFFLANVMDLSIYVQNVVPLIGIGVGVDYSLFVASRFRDELRSGRDRLDAAAVASATAGKAIFFSGLTVAVALAGMFAAGVPIFTAFAAGTIAVVFVSVAVGLTFTPAVLVALAGWLFRLDVRPGLRRLLRRPAPPPAEELVGGGFWVRWADGVMRRPWTILIATSAVLLVLAAPVLDMKTGSSGVTAIPPDQPSRVAAAQLEAVAGPGAVSPIEVVVTDSPRPLSGRDAALAPMTAAIAADPETAAVSPDVSLSEDRRSLLLTVIPRRGDDDPATQDLVARIADDYAPRLAGLDGARVLVGGAASQNRDFTETVGGNLPWVIALVMVLTFLVLVVLFRSIVLPLKAVVMTLLSVLSAYGVLVAVFQWGWLSGLLGFEHLGHVSNWVPTFLFSILFGLSMDYEVFLLSRVREHRERGAGDTEAVAAGLARTARIITAAALIMIIVFLSFLTNRLIPIKEVALGLAVAIFLDATLVRLLLVPAFMRLAGRWNWWLPAPLERVLPRIED
ncbi:MAG TPA: MMPL family transporter, partial [Miltoncostaeaceae bacterium]|nr:MMPL family transporter [Miltoncostaeaceae bacterium]